MKQRKNIGGVLRQTIEGKKDWKPNMILDDGGDLTALMHKDYKDLLKDIKV